jgi:hypothetical protein
LDDVDLRVKMDPQALMGHLVQLVPRGLLASQETRVRWETLVSLDHLVQLASLGSQDLLAPKEEMGGLEHLDLMDLREIKEMMVSQGPRDHQAWMVNMASGDNLDLRERKESQAFKEDLDLEDHLGLKDPRVILEHQAFQAIQENKDQEASKESQAVQEKMVRKVTEASRATRDRLANQGCRVHLVNLDKLDHQESREMQGHQELREILAPLVLLACKELQETRDHQGLKVAPV